MKLIMATHSSRPENFLPKMTVWSQAAEKGAARDIGPVSAEAMEFHVSKSLK